MRRNKTSIYNSITKTHNYHIIRAFIIHVTACTFMNWENDSMERTCRKQLVKLLKKKTRMQIISLKMRRNLHPDCGCVH